MYDLEKRQFLYEKFLELKNSTLVQRAYRSKYKTTKAPSRNTIESIHSSFQITRSLVRKRPLSKKKTVRTDQLIDSIKNLYLEDKQISLRKIDSVVPASVYTIRKVARIDLKKNAYKKKKTFKLYAKDHQKRLNFLSFVKKRKVEVDEFFICSDEAYFYLHGGHNIQNDKIWAEFQPNELHETPLNDEKAMVWCAFSAKKVYGPYFFNENVNSQNYLDMLKKFFWPLHLKVKKREKFYFMQDGASPHRQKDVQTWLKGKFGDRFIDAAHWPPRSPDLNPCDFSLWGTLKKTVYNPRPKNLEELKENIKSEFRNFKKSDLKSIFENLKKRLSILKTVKGGHIEHWLK
jgi:hypothetical protein